MKIMRSSSSRSCSSKPGSPDTMEVARVSSANTRLLFCSRKRPRRRESIAELCATRKSQARRVLRNPLVRPYLESAQHCFLHALLSQIQARGPQDACEVRHDTAHLVPK